VTKYEHHLQEVFNFTRGEGAAICVLLLRGPQTPGELRGRCERMHRFEELEDVLSTLQKLMQREPALVATLPRQAGMKEIRYAHLLSGEPEAGAVVASRAAETADAADPERLTRLEAEVARLREELDAVKARLDRGEGPAQPSEM
jgi:hypothetical protein